MRKILLAFLLVIICVSTSFSAPAKVGMLTPIGGDVKNMNDWAAKIETLENNPYSMSEFKNEEGIFFYDDLTSMLMALNSGQIDRIAVPAMTAKYISARNDKLIYIDYLKPVLGYSLAVIRGEILTEINRAISEMKSDGTINKLKQKYISELGKNEPEPVNMPKIDGAETLKIAVTGDFPAMDCILADGTPAGFNVAFIAELSKRINKNFELVNIHAGARESALSSGKVDMLFWTRSIYNEKGEVVLPLDNFTGAAISEPYLMDSRGALELKK